LVQRRLPDYGILFILGLKYMSSPKTARFGNRLSMAGMLIA